MLWLFNRLCWGQRRSSRQPTVPSDDARVVTYVTQLTSNVFSAARTTGLVQEFDTLPNQQFQLETLPNKYNEGGYQMISKYINPGTKPELFDVNTGLINGDGTKLYSIKYTKCSGSDYSIFLDDNFIRYQIWFSDKV